MTDENLLTVAKLGEQLRGDLDGADELLDHTGLVTGDDLGAVSFLASIDQEDGGSLLDSKLGRTTLQTISTADATDAVREGNYSLLSHLVGVTEQDLDASALSLPLRLNQKLENNGAPAFLVAVGNPNAGKTNTVLLLAEIRDLEKENLLIISNFDSSLTDLRVTSAHGLAVALLEHRDVPKFIILDESSTHFDARTYRHEVATQWTPLAKRFAKLGVDAVANIAHTGKDLHPEAKRLATLPLVKQQKDVAEFYGRWPADSDSPVDLQFNGAVGDLEATTAEYDPDDAAPWSWDLEPEQFAKDLTWSELLAELKKNGSTS